MNYFELFNIKPNYELDANELEVAYLNLQKKYHPDNCNSIEEQLEAVEKTIEVNDAYNILADDVSLLVYYVKVVLNIELTESEIQDHLSYDCLMYLLDIQEGIVENPTKTDEYKQILKEKTLSIALKVKAAIKEENKQDLKESLARLVFFNKSLKHI